MKLVYAKANPEAIKRVNDGNIPEGYTEEKPPKDKEGFTLKHIDKWEYVPIPVVKKQEEVK